MTAVNNSVKIGTMLSFKDPNDFYFLQILKRRKDNPDLGRDMIVLKNYYIESLDQYIKIVPEVIKLCDFENARAYFRLNKRNYEKLSFPMLKLIMEYTMSKSFKSNKNAFDHIVGLHHSDPDRKWLIDIDWDDMSDSEESGRVLEYIRDAIKKTGRDNTVEILPSKNGVHFICRPFNLSDFKVKFPKVTVHRDNPTILYCP